MKFFKKKLSETPKEVNVSNPYIIRIENTTDEEKDWVMFGSNKFLNLPNFGSNPGVQLTNWANKDSSYSSILQELSSCKVKIGKLRFQSNNQLNLHQTISHHKLNNDSGYFKICYEKRNLFLSLLKDAYQMQSDIVDVSLLMEIDNSIHLSGTIAPKSTFIISLFPIEIVRIGEDKNYSTPRLSGLNVAPVIIKQVTDLKGWFKKIKNKFVTKKK
jgi:hypothetical protein